MTREDLEKIAEIVIKHDLYVLSDEIYSELTYTGENHVSIASLPGMWSRTIVVNGFSKSYAMTGWRIGYVAAPALIMAQMLKIHQFAIMCAPTTAQYAAIEAMKNGDEDIAYMRAEYNARRKYLLDAFAELDIPCFEAEGAFYVFPCIKKFGMTSDEFANRLLEEQHLAVIPGTAFGDSGEGYLRVSYAYSLKSLKKAMKRIELFIEGLKA
jgi:aminotransferase